ncbi:MAG: hypothetical protein HC878_00035 [Leptolyngbyaceae cyanobacterium SL_5_14]|nr:hypothetical protein [Leptolyngbyaceae cyanobacterium SL_5_14]
MEEIFRILHQATAASSRSLDTTNKILYPILATVSNSDADRRTIRVADPVNPALETPDLKHIRGIDGLDDHLPEIGSTVICFFIDGNINNGWFLPVQNATRPPQVKDDPKKDQVISSPGNVTWKITKSLTITTPGGQTLKFLENGDIELSNLGATLLFSEGDGVQITSDEIVRINGKGICVEGGRDSDGDVFTNTGQ